MAAEDEVRETSERHLSAFVANAFTRTAGGWHLYALSDLVNPAG